ncbi:MAG: transcriptional regulator [Alphaproteobacteria bacterium]|nr:transcriptional regulator [Alphaproteobacteria bacterium]MBQ2811067.1 transcriptional regulator [Alphaproteobacteria bacterium]
MNKVQLPPEVMKKAVKGISYISHPLRLRILEFLDVNGQSSVSAIAGGLGAEQIFVSQSLKKLREAGLVTTKRSGIFIYYKIREEYPASIFVCLRKLFGYMANDFNYLLDGFKAMLPKDYTNMAANQIKLFANYDKMRILEYLIINGKTNVTDIINAINSEQLKVSQYLKRLRDDGFVSSSRDGRYIYYEITAGIHKTALECIRKRYNNLKNKEDF